MASRKDYVLFATHVQNLYRQGGNDIWPHLDRFVIDASINFLRDNPRFDPEKFATACGMSPSIAKAIDWVSRSTTH